MPQLPFLRTFTALAGLIPMAASAGPVSASAFKEPVTVVPLEHKLAQGTATLGWKFSDELQSGYLDSVTPFWGPGDFTIFLNTRTIVDDGNQTISSYGLGVRYLVPDHDVIVGANAYYDSLHSQFGNDFDQLGLGLEVLTKWFDARVNWYLPEGTIYEEDQFSSNRSASSLTPRFRDGFLIKQREVTSDRRNSYKRYEGALSGYNMEAGFLLPYIDQYAEVRVLAGYYNYDGPFTKHYEGVKGRIEAHLLPGLIADLEYWDDEALMGGHWTGGLRATVPFSLFKLLKGRNPFEGTAAMFTPRKRDFRERRSEQVMRSHRIMTSESDPVSSGSTQSTESQDLVVGAVPRPMASRPAPAAPPQPPPPPP